MAQESFYKGSALFALARKRARELSIETHHLKMVDLIRKIQKREGYTPCFRMKERCPEILCCWQESCGAAMIADPDGLS